MYTLKQNASYFALFFAFLCIGAYLIFTVPKGDVLITFNDQYNWIWNQFFFYITILGSGIPTLLVCIGLLFYRFGHALLLFVSTGLSALTTQLCKCFLFEEVKRPKHYFDNEVFAQLDKVAGLYINAYHSFPSGHTTIVFATCCALILLVSDKRWGYAFFIVALLTGLSRVYLLQHFFIDIYGGAIVGTFVTLMVFAILPSLKVWQNRNRPARSLQGPKFR
ncbi:MAG: hypothetical protein BRD50_03790 [Bacteroidetes bacterium SW_11_45_7]|nr:MAG: hypothetical protein BRD50_03790 [Bacteroidetes bacterium SW_11_45_7]